MKYYLYVSDAKVDMLLQQIEKHGAKEVKSHLKIDWKIFKTGREWKSDIEPQRIERLETVVSYLRRYGRVGTFEEPDDYIDDVADMTQWGDPTVALFLGSSGETIFTLAGSATHLIQGSSAPEGLTGFTSLNMILSWLSKREKKLNIGDKDSAWTEMIFRFWHQMPQFQPSQRLEVFAKTLFYDPAAKQSRSSERTNRVVLATPLYVAMSDGIA